MIDRRRTYRLSVLLVVVSSALLSTSGLFVRSLESTTAIQAACYRALFVGLGATAWLAAFHGTALPRRFREVGRIGVLAGGLGAFAGISMVTSLFHTTVANTTFILSATPLVTASLAWLLLGERLALGTLVPILVSMVGLAIMIEGELAVGHGLGSALALASVVNFALFVVILRSRASLDMSPTVTVAAAIATLLAGLLSIAVGHGIALPWHDLGLCFLWGGVVTAAGHLMFVRAARDLSGRRSRWSGCSSSSWRRSWSGSSSPRCPRRRRSWGALSCWSRWRCGPPERCARQASNAALDPAQRGWLRFVDPLRMLV